ncbi:hypothetical protein Tco_0926642 [Tanacetum coccineum]|uniref:Uncharacterized protein n=1 Tax=Tanacetum coccineum TaxID=301880 RepID=A0ABQ5DD61_9ASTR
MGGAAGGWNGVAGADAVGEEVAGRCGGGEKGMGTEGEGGWGRGGDRMRRVEREGGEMGGAGGGMGMTGEVVSGNDFNGHGFLGALMMDDAACRGWERCRWVGIAVDCDWGGRMGEGWGGQSQDGRWMRLEPPMHHPKQSDRLLRFP